MNNQELLQQLAALNWIFKKDSSEEEAEKAKQIFTGVSASRIIKELYHRVTKDKEIEQAQAIVILRVADYVKAHPRATEQQLVEFVRAELQNFAKAVDSL